MTRSFLVAGCFLLLLSAASAGEEIRVEAEADGVIVRSPVSGANFLFRAPPAFKQVDPPEGTAVALAADAEGGKATILLRLGELTATEARAGLDEFLRAREEEYRRGLGGKMSVTGARGRRLAAIEGGTSVRFVLALFDGARRYELILEASPPDGPLAAQLAAVAEGFTILDPKGLPEGAPAAAADAKASAIEHDYYRVRLLKPAGFLQQDVDPERDPGIFLHLRREDEQKSRCDIRVRVHLAKALKESIEGKAQKRIDDFHGRCDATKGPGRPSRARWPGATAAFRFKQVGKLLDSGLVAEEEWLFVDHANGRVYEVEVTCFGAGSRTFRKEIDAFWRGLTLLEK